MQIVMSDKRDYGREIPREVLINGANVPNGSAIAKNECCRSCAASGLFSASTSSVLER